MLQKITGKFSHLPKLHKVLIAGLVFVVAILFLWFGFFSKSSNIPLSMQFTQEPEKKLEALGTDATSVLAKAKELQKKSDYLAEYDVVVLDTIDASKSAKYRRIERKLGDLIRIDSNLSDNTPATRYVANAQGIFLCSFVQEEIPQCYDITSKQKEAEQKSQTNKADIDILNNWQKTGAIRSDITSKTIKISNMQRACDQVESTLTGKNITQGMLSDIAKLMPAKATSEDFDKSKQLLDDLTITSSVCYDRETGLPLKTVITTTLGEHKQTASQNLASLSKEIKFIEKLTPKTIVSSESQTFKLLNNSLRDGNIFYFAGEKGIYTIKNNMLAAYDEKINRDTGDIYAMKKFQGKTYLGASRGLYSLKDGKWKLELDALKTWAVLDFVEFDNLLYAATGNGVFILGKNGWAQPSTSFKEVAGAQEFVIIKDRLNVLTKKGIYVFNGTEWKESVLLYEYGSRKLYSSDDRLFVATSSATLEVKDKTSVKIADYKTTGDVLDVISFNNNVFIAGRKGIYTENEKYKMSDQEVGYVKDFFVFQGVLFAGTDAGIYRFSETGWFPMGDESLGRIDTFFEKDGALYAGGLLGIYRFDGLDWIKGMVTDVNNFYSINDQLYVTSNNKTFLNLITEVEGDSKKLFDLPSNAKVIKL